MTGSGKNGKEMKQEVKRERYQLTIGWLLARFNKIKAFVCIEKKLFQFLIFYFFVMQPARRCYSEYKGGRGTPVTIEMSLSLYYLVAYIQSIWSHDSRPMNAIHPHPRK